MNVAAWLARAGRALPDRPAVGFGTGVHQTYGELTARAASLAAGLAALGLAPGDRVAIAAKNCREYMECLYGVWWGGFAPVPANAKLHGAELAWMIDNAGATSALRRPRRRRRSTPTGRRASPI